VSDQELVARYFAGDLDRVERRRFEADLERSPALRERFDETYDRRTEERGLLTLEPARALDECFSLETLELFAEQKLDPAERELVDAHLACPLCREQLEGLATAEVVPLFRRRVLIAASAGLISAVAAASLLFIFSPARELPRYALEVSGGEKPLRSGDPTGAGRLVALPNNVLTFTLRPELETDRAVELSSFIQRGDVLEPWTLPIDRSQRGALRISGETRALFPGVTGAFKLILIVAEVQRFEVEIALAEP
jgi:hypothetical protein